MPAPVSPASSSRNAPRFAGVRDHGRHGERQPQARAARKDHQDDGSVEDDLAPRRARAGAGVEQRSGEQQQR